VRLPLLFFVRPSYRSHYPIDRSMLTVMTTVLCSCAAVALFLCNVLQKMAPSGMDSLLFSKTFSLKKSTPFFEKKLDN
jgi:hypothetical protein